MKTVNVATAFGIALLSNIACAGPLLDRFMPYTDYYAEGASNDSPCEVQQTGDGAEPVFAEVCSLDGQTQATLRRLLGETRDGKTVTMGDVADALRDMLANGQPVDSVIDALPLFIRQQLPNILQSRHCRFLQNGELSAYFDDAYDGVKGKPYDEFISVTVFCDEPRNFRIALTSFAEHDLGNLPATALYQRSSVPVKLVAQGATYPARVSFLNEGRLLSEQVFTGGYGEADISVIVRLHAPASLDEAPDGHGKIVGFPLSSRLVIYELN